jgi:hypothetical protein
LTDVDWRFLNKRLKNDFKGEEFMFGGDSDREKGRIALQGTSGNCLSFPSKIQDLLYEPHLQTVVGT